MTGDRKHRRRWPWVAGALLVSSGFVAVLLVAQRNGSIDWSESHRIVSVEQISYQETVEISGNLEPMDVRDLSFPTSGKVTEVAVRQGMMVNRNTLLARLDDKAAQYELAVIESTLEQRRLSAPAREIRLLEMERDLKAQAVRDHELRSPISGKAASVDLKAGDHINAGRRAVRVVDVSALKARVQIDELDAPRVKIGLPVRFTFDAIPETRITGRVSSLSVEGRITPEGLAVLDGEVLIDQPPENLLAGYSFSGEILLGEERKVLVVPIEALVRRGDRIFVYRLSAGSAEPELRRVEARLLDAERIQIFSGLEENDRVLVALNYGQASGSGKMTTTQLLNSMRSRARIPIFGGKSSDGEE